MSHLQAGMSFYGEMPDTFSVVLNADHPLISGIINDSEKECAEALKPINAEIRGLEARKAALEMSSKDKKDDEIPQDEKDDLKKTNEDIEKQKEAYKTVLSDYAAKNDKIHQLIDLALLQNGMLRGEALDKFLTRSLSMI